jgi:hypothetical protein
VLTYLELIAKEAQVNTAAVKSLVTPDPLV